MSMQGVTASGAVRFLSCILFITKYQLMKNTLCMTTFPRYVFAEGALDAVYSTVNVTHISSECQHVHLYMSLVLSCSIL